MVFLDRCVIHRLAVAGFAGFSLLIEAGHSGGAFGFQAALRPTTKIRTQLEQGHQPRPHCPPRVTVDARDLLHLDRRDRAALPDGPLDQHVGPAFSRSELTVEVVDFSRVGAEPWKRVER